MSAGCVAAVCSTSLVTTTGAVSVATGAWRATCPLALELHWPLAHSEDRRVRIHWASAVVVMAADVANTAISRKRRMRIPFCRDLEGNIR